MTFRRLGVVFLLLISASGARADEKYDQGVAAYAAKDYEGAIEAFKASYAADPRPETLFAWAQSERLNGNCPGAIVLYRRFLAERPEGVQADAARLPLARCERAVSSLPGGPASEPASAPADPEPEALPPVAAPPEPEGRRFWRDPLGDALVGGGVAAAVVGVAFLVAAGSADDAATQATTYDEFAMNHEDAGTRRTIGAVALSVGIGLVVAGSVRWWLVGRRGAERSPAIGVGFGPHGWGVFAAGRF